MADSSLNCHSNDFEDTMIMYKKEANAVVSFNIVYEKQDVIQPVLTFKPVMSHQIFGENECIFGYRSLAIDLYYLHNSAKCYVNVSSSGIVESDVYKPDNIMECLNPWLPENFTTNKEEFIKLIKEESHDVIFGKVLHTFTAKGKFHLHPKTQVNVTYKITQCDLKDENFKMFHSRFETYVIWFIDGANYIDLADPKWEIFYVYEEKKSPQTQQLYVTPVGFCTVYKFYSYPQNIRSRISQFFILPTHQKRGIGTELYKTVFKVFLEDPICTDITVEEPTSTFQKIRDIHDCCLVNSQLRAKEMSILSTPVKTVFEIVKKQKLCKKQCQRVYDILCGFEAFPFKQSYDQFLTKINKRIQNEVKDKMKTAKRMRNQQGEAVSILLDQNAIAEAEFKRYKEDLEMAIKYIGNVFC
ncbi:histone acetyltransferase type B catalytic subunit [Diorhabda carinulata]|uniref:histone acetyltransferase type B catalytic subunit n=1 Tax=Diorhabda carinulata TaxID=1163345 RepID=UPI0025A08507|nr:histone acetyltransferase type B catalytic subunit [Diorhabda carinulata]